VGWIMILFRGVNGKYKYDASPTNLIQ